MAVHVSVGLYFADGPPARRGVGIVLDAPALDIPAGEPAHAVEDRYIVPVPVDVAGVYAYLHRLGRAVEVTAEAPDGTLLGLLRIDDWQFDWQDGYRYVEPVRLPAGTLLVARFHFDNSGANPHNPTSPPVRVRYNPDDTTPRAEVFLLALPAAADDEAALVQNLLRKQARNDLLGLQAMLRADPNDYRSHTDLAARYLSLNQLALARQHLETALSLAPDHATAHYNLGSLLVAEATRPAPSRRSARRSRCSPSTPPRTTTWERCSPPPAPRRTRSSTTASRCVSGHGTPAPATTWRTPCWRQEKPTRRSPISAKR